MRYVNSAYTYSPQKSNVISADNGDSAYHVRMWQHGLKHSHANLMRPFFFVAPHAGAWIETVLLRNDGKLWIVAPSLGVWAGLWFMRLACVMDLGA